MCFAVILSNPADRIAPDPKINWQVRELNNYLGK